MFSSILSCNDVIGIHVSALVSYDQSVPYFSLQQQAHEKTEKWILYAPIQISHMETGQSNHHNIPHAGLPSAMTALEDAKIRFATRLQIIDDAHLLVSRILPPLRARGRGAGSRQRTVTKVQMLGSILPPVPRPKLTPPHYSEGCRTDPTEGTPKETAAKAFIQWWDTLPPDDVLVFSDGSEQYKDSEKLVGYGYAIYQGKRQLNTGYGSINPISHVFDAEAIGAWKGLYRTIRMAPEVSNSRIWMCIDSTSVLWCMRGNAAPTS